MTAVELLILFYGFMVGVGVTFVWMRGKLREAEAERDLYKSHAEILEQVVTKRERRAALGKQADA